MEDGQTPGTFLKVINNEFSAGANRTKNQQGGKDNVNNPSTPNAKDHNGGSNVETGDS